MEQDLELHRKLGADLFNATWDLIENPARTPEQDDLMIHSAHASRYHWGQVGAPENLARGEWQISRVYSILSRSEPALYHARRCLEICQQHGIGDFDLAFAYEALARAYAVGGDEPTARAYMRLAFEAGEMIVEGDDREVFMKDLGTVPGFEAEAGG